MPAAPTSSPTTPPDPPQDHAGAVVAEPSRTARLLGLVRMLMDYGFELACTLQRRAAPNDVSVSAMIRPFGTINLALILARITRGLRLAGALEERLMRRPVAEEKKPASTSAPSPRQPRAARPAAARRTLEDPDPRLALLPTSEQIAADIRRRPVGAVIADICRDLGILPGHKLWRELSLAIIDHGGSLVGLTKDIFKRLRLARAILRDGTAPAWPTPEPQFSPTGGTGPP
jgi:hypothetical protein